MYLLIWRESSTYRLCISHPSQWSEDVAYIVTAAQLLAGFVDVDGDTLQSPTYQQAQMAL